MNPSSELLALLLRRQSHYLNNVLTRLSGQLSLAARDREVPDKLDRRFEKMNAASRGLADGVRVLHLVARYEAEGAVENDLAALRAEIDTLLSSPEPARARLRLSDEECWTGQFLVLPGRLRLVLFALTESLATTIGGDGILGLDLRRNDDSGYSFLWTAPSAAHFERALEAPYGQLSRELIEPPSWTLSNPTDTELRLEVPRA